MTTPSPGDELRAAVSARRDLGPDFEDAIVESFLDKMGKEVDRRVDERLASVRPSHADRRSEGMRLALAIVSMSLGTILSIVTIAVSYSLFALVIIWGAIAIVNGVFNNPGGGGPKPAR
ncbi:MAG: hypothetical protein HOV86_02050 [Thermoactinospora sp.]|nr:hypothetical protein [Thermoactinospora sp.]